MSQICKVQACLKYRFNSLSCIKLSDASHLILVNLDTVFMPCAYDKSQIIVSQQVVLYLSLFFIKQLSTNPATIFKCPRFVLQTNNFERYLSATRTLAPKFHTPHVVAVMWRGELGCNMTQQKQLIAQQQTMYIILSAYVVILPVRLA